MSDELPALQRVQIVLLREDPWPLPHVMWTWRLAFKWPVWQVLLFLTCRWVALSSALFWVLHTHSRGESGRHVGAGWGKQGGGGADDFGDEHRHLPGILYCKCCEPVSAQVWDFSWKGFCGCRASQSETWIRASLSERSWLKFLSATWRELCFPDSSTRALVNNLISG